MYKNKFNLRKVVAIATCLAVTAIYSGCDKNGGDDDGGGDGKIAVTGVSLDKTKLTLTVGKTETLTATVVPNEATNREVTWSSGEPAVVSVNDKGEVTAKVAGGPVTITVTTKDGNKKATCEVTVSATVVTSGVTWTKVTANPFGTSAINDIILGNNMLVATGTFSKIAYSSGNINQWTTLDLSDLSLGNIYRIARGGGKYVVINYQGTAAYADESDITKWKLTDKEREPFFETQVFNPGIVYCKDRFIAHRNGVMKFSTDGGAVWKNTSWTGGGATPFTNIYGIVWNGTRFVAVGGKGNFPTSGIIAHSTDGETWTEVTGHPFSDVAVYGFLWDGNKFIALAPWRVAHSSDGLNWSLYYNNSTSNPSSTRIAFGGGKYVVVGDSGKNGEIWTSTDAKTWLKEEVSVFSNYVTVKSIIYDGKKFIVAGVEDDKNVIAYSNDLQ